MGLGKTFLNSIGGGAGGKLGHVSFAYSENKKIEVNQFKVGMFFTMLHLKKTFFKRLYRVQVEIHPYRQLCYEGQIIHKTASHRYETDCKLQTFD